VRIWHPIKGAESGCVWLFLGLLLALFLFAYLTGKFAG
jgi:hypothetical protein